MKKLLDYLRQHDKTASRSRIRAPRLSLENLEDRRLMTASIILDFGEAFAYNSNLDAQVLNVSDDRLDDSDLNGPTGVIPSTLTSLMDALKDRVLDYNGDGQVNMADVQVLGDDVANLVRRAFEPFDVSVLRRSSSSLDQIATRLAGGSNNDAYVVIAGAKGDAGGLGWALVDTNFNDDNVVFGFAEDLLDTVDSARDKVAYSLARTAVHEAAHSFGLEHLESSELTDDELMLRAGDMMNVNNQDRDSDGETDRFGELNLGYRWTFVDDDGDNQSAYGDLEDALGKRLYRPAYVTGTGANDTITLTNGSGGSVNVTVNAYRDDSYGSSDLIDTKTYSVNPAYGILVEGGLGNDRIDATGISYRVTLRGGDGDDILIGGAGNDTLMGDSGDDTLSGMNGNDTYLFTGPRWLDYDADVITDLDGGLDKLDFSQLPFATQIDLASTANQTTERQMSGAMVINGQIQNSYAWIIGQTFESRLDLRLGTAPFSNSTGIETVVGTDFNDVLRGNELANQLLGRGGMDRLEGRAGNDYLSGGYGNDVYEFKGSQLGTDTVEEYSYTGTDDVLDFSLFGGGVNIDIGNSAPQTVNSGDLVIDLTSRYGINHVTGSQYNDAIIGNYYGNWLYGLGGNDELSGGLGNDFLKGGYGNDDLMGNDGVDSIFGEWGNDYLDGGYDGDKDLLYGGSGQDTFVANYKYGLVKTRWYSYYGWLPMQNEDSRMDFNYKTDDLEKRYHF